MHSEWILVLYEAREYLVRMLGLTRHERPEVLPSIKPGKLAFDPGAKASFFEVKAACDESRGKTKKCRIAPLGACRAAGIEDALPSFRQACSRCVLCITHGCLGVLKMTKEELLSRLDRSFGGLPRPAMFIRGTCSCDECLAHEETMQSLSLPDLPLEKLGNPGWDPVCFASDEAFAYLMPGLVRLVLTHTEDYIGQFLFHLDAADRVAAFSGDQRRVLLDILDYLVMNAAGVLDRSMAADDLLRVREKLEQAV